MIEVKSADRSSSGNTLTPEEQLLRDKPRPFIQKAIEIFQSRGGKRIVEIGTSDARLIHAIDEDGAKWGEHCCNSGHSTFLWALSGAEEVWSVDINPDTVDNARKHLEESEYTKNCRNVHLVAQDALEFLKNFDKPIDLLYLDGWDVATSQYDENHLTAYLLAKKNLHHDSLILIDDTDLDSGGKGKRVVPQALEDGYRVVFKGRQTLLVHASKELDLDLSRLHDFKFEHDTNDYATHQPVLYQVLKMTSGPILELGCGTGSTPLIHQFAPGRKIVTVEHDLNYLNPLKARYEDKNHQFIGVSNWTEILEDPRFHQSWSIVFIDQSPWEARHQSILRFKDLTEFIILHDSDFFPMYGFFGSVKRPILPFIDEGAHDYGDMFRYWKEFYPKKPWIVETGPPTLVGSNVRPCDFDVSFNI